LPRMVPLRAEEVLLGLTELAARLGVEVRIEPFELKLAGKGGLCRIAGRAVVLVDARLALVDQLGVLGQALGLLDPNDVPSALRPYLRTGHGPVRTQLRLRPLARAR
jgi:hypothetical protein